MVVVGWRVLVGLNRREIVQKFERGWLLSCEVKISG